jgi:hypothetical protein
VPIVSPGRTVMTLVPLILRMSETFIVFLRCRGSRRTRKARRHWGRE